MRDMSERSGLTARCARAPGRIDPAAIRSGQGLTRRRSGEGLFRRRLGGSRQGSEFELNQHGQVVIHPPFVDDPALDDMEMAHAHDEQLVPSGRAQPAVAQVVSVHDPAHGNGNCRMQRIADEMRLSRLTDVWMGRRRRQPQGFP